MPSLKYSSNEIFERGIDIVTEFNKERERETERERDRERERQRETEKER